MPAAVYRLRWGKGWACPAYGHGRCAELKGRARLREGPSARNVRVTQADGVDDVITTQIDRRLRRLRAEEQQGRKE